MRLTLLGAGVALGDALAAVVAGAVSGGEPAIVVADGTDGVAAGAVEGAPQHPGAAVDIVLDGELAAASRRSGSFPARTA